MDPEKDKKKRQKLLSYIRIFLLPTLVLKGFLMYFGLHYAMYPDRGYETGLIVVAVLVVCNFGYFLYMNWNDPEDEESR